MKTTLIIIALFLNSILYCQITNYSFTIQVDSLNPGEYPIDIHLVNNITTDTTIYSGILTPENNRISIKGYVDVEYQIYFQVLKAGMFDCAIGPDDSAVLRVTARRFGEDFTISGSVRPVTMANYLFKNFVPQVINLKRQQTVIDSIIINNSKPEDIKAAKRKYDSLYESYYQYNIHFADTSQSAVAIAFALDRYLGKDSLHDVYPIIEKTLNRFGSIVSTNSLLKSYNSSKNIQTSYSTGNILDYVKLFDKNSQQNYKRIVNKNKLILIDFWASWCIPCREEFPYLNEAYKQFKNKGFDIVSISLDKNKEVWMKALKTINNSWENNYWDSKGWESESVKLLKIKSIPRNYLIDNKGKIYAKDIRGAEILDILRKLL